MQICMGMISLANEKIVHRDLAARNVLVFAFDQRDVSKTVVKMTDFGLSREGTGYYGETLHLLMCLIHSARVNGLQGTQCQLVTCRLKHWSMADSRRHWTCGRLGWLRGRSAPW